MLSVCLSGDYPLQDDAFQMVDKPVVKKPMGFPPRRPQGGRGWGGRGDGGREGDRDGGRGAGGRGAWGQQGGGRGGWGQQGGRGGRGGPFGGWGNRPPFWRDQPRQTYSSRCGGGAVWVVWDGCCCCECRVLSLPLVNCRFAKRLLVRTQVSKRFASDALPD